MMYDKENDKMMYVAEGVDDWLLDAIWGNEGMEEVRKVSVPQGDSIELKLR